MNSKSNSGERFTIVVGKPASKQGLVHALRAQNNCGLHIKSFLSDDYEELKELLSCKLLLFHPHGDMKDFISAD